MKITNKHNLPEAIVNMVAPKERSGEYPINRVSVSNLLSPVQTQILSRRYDDEIEED